MVESIFQEIEGQVRARGSPLSNTPTHSWAMIQRTRGGPRPPVTKTELPHNEGEADTRNAEPSGA